MKVFVVYIAIFALCNSGLGKFLGKYRSWVESVRDYEDIPRDFIDWKLYVRKLNRTEQVLTGYMDIKKEVGPLQTELHPSRMHLFVADIGDHDLWMVCPCRWKNRVESLLVVNKHLSHWQLVYHALALPHCVDVVHWVEFASKSQVEIDLLTDYFRIDLQGFLRLLNPTLKSVPYRNGHYLRQICIFELTINLEKWVDGGFKKFMIEDMTTNNVCTDKDFKVIMENYNGTLTPECIFEPGKRYLKPFNIDKEMHKHVQMTVYGKFRVGMRFHANSRNVMGFQVVIVYEKIK